MDTKRCHIIVETSGMNSTMQILIFEDTTLKTAIFHVPFPLCPS